MSTLDRTAILSVDDLPREKVEISEWKGSVYVRALTGEERDALERMISKDKVSRASIVALVTVDEAGKRLFTDADVAALSGKHGGALEKIVNAALRFNTMTPEGIEDAGNG